MVTNLAKTLASAIMWTSSESKPNQRIGSICLSCLSVYPLSLVVLKGQVDCMDRGKSASDRFSLSHPHSWWEERVSCGRKKPLSKNAANYSLYIWLNYRFSHFSAFMVSACFRLAYPRTHKL